MEKRVTDGEIGSLLCHFEERDADKGQWPNGFVVKLAQDLRDTRATLSTTEEENRKLSEAIEKAIYYLELADEPFAASQLREALAKPKDGSAG